MLNILYIGPNDSEWAQMNRPVSLAAAKWARGFLTALSKVTNVTALTHTYEIAWPKGKIFWRGYDKRLYPDGWDCVAVTYPVLKFVREWWWRFAYAVKAKKIIREKNVDVVLIYNCYESWQVPVLRAINTAFPNVKIIPIILDGDDPRKDDWGWMKRAAAYSDAFVALSWWVYQNIPANTGKPAYHFDGGAEGWRGRGGSEGSGGSGGLGSLEGKAATSQTCQTSQTFQASKPYYTLVHTGALDQWRGLDFMVGVVKRLTDKRKDVKFVFCGKSSEKVLRDIFKDNPQVELPGFVTEEEMGNICNSADVLLNVRNPNHPDNILNYPSKLPHYLSFGRPIVSTCLQSLSPDYGEVVNFPMQDTVDSYVAKLEEVLGWDIARRECECKKIKAWFESRKSWDTMVAGLVKWIAK